MIPTDTPPMAIVLTAEEVTGVLGPYLEAMKEPSRAAVAVDILLNGEASAAGIARRQGTPPNNVYHHLRVLRRLGITGEPRIATAVSYVEKFYSLDPLLLALLGLEGDAPQFPDELEPGAKQLWLAALCMTLSALSRRAAEETTRRGDGESDPWFWADGLILKPFFRMIRGFAFALTVAPPGTGSTETQ